jgi:hypothetical protein
MNDSNPIAPSQSCRACDEVDETHVNGDGRGYRAALILHAAGKVSMVSNPFRCLP